MVRLPAFKVILRGVETGISIMLRAQEIELFLAGSFQHRRNDRFLKTF